MSEELIQRNLVDSPEKMGDWNFYNIGATTLKALKSAKIIPNHDYDEYEKKKPDALIVKKPIVIAAIEYKTPQQLRTQKQIEKAITQELGTARALNAKIYIITDGKKSIWVNPKTGNEITQEDGSKITLNFDKNSTDCINLINKIAASITSDNDQIKPPSAVDPLPLAQKVWQDLWAVSGATPENCLYTFVEIFIFKYLSDLGVLQGVHSFYSLISQYGSNTDDDVLDFYAQTIRVKIKQLFPWNPKDKTTIINGTIFVSKDDKAVSGYATVFRRILNRFNDFGTLENIDYDFKSKLFETFLKESISKKNWGQYFTPLKVVRAIVNMVELSAGMKVCDPACGVGKFLLEPILHDLHKFFKVENGKLTPQISLSGFDKGFDKEEQKTIILAKANMLIYMSSMIKENPGITEQFSELFNKTFFLQTNTILGTLAQPIKEEYDLILTNPPYVMSGSSNLKEEISKQDELKAHYAVSATYTKKYVNAHSGNYPVYSGNTYGEFAFIDSFDYNEPALTWAIDGLAGYIMVHDSPFSATNHRGVLIPKTSDINLTYAKYVLEPIFRELKKGREGENGENEYTSLPPFMIKGISVPFPVDDNGNISLAAQKEIANKYLMLEQCKKEMSEKFNTLIMQKIKL